MRAMRATTIFSFAMTLQANYVSWYLSVCLGLFNGVFSLRFSFSYTHFIIFSAPQDMSNCCSFLLLLRFLAKLMMFFLSFSGYSILQPSIAPRSCKLEDGPREKAPPCG